jgi:hypothetical protein
LLAIFTSNSLSSPALRFGAAEILAVNVARGARGQPLAAAAPMTKSMNEARGTHT